GILRVEECVITDPRPVEGRHDLAAVPGDHLADVLAQDLRLGQHVVRVHVDARQGQHALAPAPRGARSDISSQIWPGQVADVQRAIDRRLGYDDDGYIR